MSWVRLTVVVLLPSGMAWAAEPPALGCSGSRCSSL